MLYLWSDDEKAAKAVAKAAEDDEMAAAKAAEAAHGAEDDETAVDTAGCRGSRKRREGSRGNK